MAFDLATILFFVLLSLAASTVNGGLGYGYSSISTPLALLVVVSRVLNPAYVLLEALLNTFMLVVSGKTNIKATFRRTLPILVAIAPGVFLGSLALNVVAPLWVRLFVYLFLLPLILLQAAGFRRPVGREGTVGLPLGAGIGFVYSLTTISGPPIALFMNNQGLPKQEFKASLAQVRIMESYLTCATYYFLGFFTLPSLQLFSYVSPPVLLGIPLGMLIVRRMSVETFRRICMSFDAWIVGYGLTRVMMQGAVLGISEVEADAIWAGVIGIDVILLYRFFKVRRGIVVGSTVAVEVAESPWKEKVEAGEGDPPLKPRPVIHDYPGPKVTMSKSIMIGLSSFGWTISKTLSIGRARLRPSSPGSSFV